MSIVEYELNEEDTSFVAVNVKRQDKITLEANICSFYFSLRPVKYLELSIGESYVSVL